MAEVYCERPSYGSWVAVTTADPAETRYGIAVDVKRAADLYAQGWTLRQIGAELYVPLDRRGPSTSLRRGHHASRRSGSSGLTEQILELRDQGLMAGQVDMTRSGVWSRYRKARPPQPPRQHCSRFSRRAGPEPCYRCPSSRD
jgi:hypothetical protein